MRKLEICVDSLQSALNAEANGADRIELCDNLFQGGLTPSAGKIKKTVELLNIPVFVLVRPRKADFLYSELEFQIMLKDIEMVKFFGGGGIVSGVLEADGKVDVNRMKQLIEAAAPLPFTCHRAFDMAKDPFEALEQLIDLGVDRILTSGQQINAMLGRPLIEKLVDKANGKIEIMACGGIRPDNIQQLLEIKGLNEFHAAVRTTVESKMDFLGHTTMGDEQIEQEFQWSEADPQLIRGLSELVHQK